MHVFNEASTERNPLPSYLRYAVQTSAERLADAYLVKANGRTLLDFLALPKIGMVPALCTKEGNLRLTAYPQASGRMARTLGG